MKPTKIPNPQGSDTIAEAPVVNGALIAPQSPVATTGALPITQTLDQSAAFYPDVTPPQSVVESPHHLRVYKNNSKLRTLLVVGLLITLLVGGGLLTWSLKQRDDRNTFQQQALNGELPEEINKQDDQNLNTSLLTVNTNLTVNGSSIIQGNTILGGDTSVNQNLVVRGATSLTTLVVAGDGNISGQLTVNGTVVANNLQGNLTGDVRGSFTGNAAGTFTGAATGTFNGIHIGDGSGLTNINFPNCTTCVQLQAGSAADQIGNIALAGDIRARKTNLRAAINAVDTFTVQTATGETIISADTLNKNITVGNLLPNTASSGVSGSITPGYTVSNKVFTTVVADTGGSYADAARWSVKGADNFMRYVYIDQNTSDVVYVRCTDDNCANPITQTVASNPIDWTDTATIALDTNGNPYITYMVYDSPNTIHLVHCQDIDCSVSTDQVVATTLDWGYMVVVDAGPDGLARVVYESNSGSDHEFWFVRCTTVSCSTNQTTKLDDLSAISYIGAADIVIAADNTAYISYTTNSPDIIRVLHCTDINCGTYSTVDFADAEYSNSLAIGSDGMLRIAYPTYDSAGNTSGLRFIRCTRIDCATNVISDVAQGSSASYESAHIELSANNLPVLAYSKGSFNSSVNVRICQDVDCISSDEYVVDSISASYPNVFMDSNGEPAMAYFNGNNSFVVVTGVIDTQIPTLVVTAQDNMGTAIGTPQQRFGQIYGSSLDLQNYGSTTALLVNNKSGNGSGALASFQIDGVERVGITGGGSFNISGADGITKFQVGDDGNVRIGDTSAIVQVPALLNLVASNTTSNLIQVTNNLGASLLTVDSNGNISSGVLGTCAACTPVSVLNSTKIGTSSAQRIDRAKVRGNYMYAVNNNSELIVFDVSDPVLPRQKSSTMLAGSVSSEMYINGNHAYFVSESSLYVYDLTVAIKPTLVATINRTCSFASCYVASIKGLGAQVYVTDVSNDYTQYSISTYDLSAPVAPSLLGSSLILPGYVRSGNMVVDGTKLYVVTSSYLHVVDTSNPLNPILVGQLAVDGIQTIGSSLISGRYVVMGYYGSVSNTKGELILADVANPTSPQLGPTVSSTAVMEGGYAASERLEVEGNTAYLISLTEGNNKYVVNTFDLGNAAAPSYLGTFYPSQDVSLQGWSTGLAYVSGHLYIFNKNNLLVLGDYSSNFGYINTDGLQVGGGAEVKGGLKVNGGVVVNEGSNLILTGIPRPAGSISTDPTAGSLSGANGVTHYFKVTAVTPNGESAPVTHTVAGNAMGTLGYSGFTSEAVAGDPGSLTGTYRYAYTWTTNYGESTAVFSNPVVTVSGQQVNLSNVLISNSSSVTAVNIYRCTMPACSSYNLVGSVPNTTPGSYTWASFVDNNVSPGVAIPAVNTARTDTNSFKFDTTADNLPQGTTALRIYYSTNNINFTYQDYPLQGIYMYATFYDPTGGIAATPPVQATSGRLGIGTSNPTASLQVMGDAILQSDIDTVTAFQVKNSAGTVLFNADTINRRIGVNTAAASATLDVRGDAIFQSTANASTSFQFRTSTSAVVLNVDTTNQRVGIGLAGPLATLHVSAPGTSGSLFRVTDTTATARDVVDIADTGITTFRNQTDSTSAFRVQNAAGTTTVLAVNTTNLRVEIASGSDLKFMGAGNTRNAITKDYTCTATEAINDVVIVSGAATVGRTATANSNRVIGVVVTKPNATTCTIAFSGSVQVNFGANATPVAIGDPVTTSAISGMAQSNTTPVAGAVLGNSTSSKDGSNLVWILIKGN